MQLIIVFYYNSNFIFIFIHSFIIHFFQLIIEFLFFFDLLNFPFILFNYHFY